VPGTPPESGPPRRRLRLVLALAALLVLALGASGLVVLRSGVADDWLGGSDPDATASAGPIEPAPPPVLAAPATDAPVPTPVGVRAAIDELVEASPLGERLHVSVRDVATGTELYDHGARVGTVPASTTKLVTAVAALATRGPGYRIPTRVVAGATPGEVVIVGGGDPTLAAGAKGAYADAARLDQLAAQVKQALGGAAVTKVTVDSSLYTGPAYSPGWDPDVPDNCAAAVTALMVDAGRVNPKESSCRPRHRQPDLVAGRAFAKALGAPETVVKSVTRGSAPASSGGSSAGPDGGIAPGTELGRVESPPLIRLVEVMLEESDNDIAEALARQVALARGEPASFAGAATAVDAVLADLGLDPTQSDVADGSGLSRKNRITPALLTDLLVLAANGSRPELTGLFAGLPVAGWSGTLAGRYVSPAPDSNAPGVGVVRAKTGTLNGVHSISGVLTTADGRVLAFAIMADRVPVGSSSAQPALDQIAATLAACGCR
jgi:D-alanyl-D-alanine carboxypeptidase/D-alanyl-D-alanine-endopeptidase (penicillin-binding protein 4)